MNEPTLEQVNAELARMKEWAKDQFFVLPESREGQYIDGLRRAKARMEKQEKQTTMAEDIAAQIEGTGSARYVCNAGTPYGN